MRSENCVTILTLCMTAYDLEIRHFITVHPRNLWKWINNCRLYNFGDAYSLFKQLDYRFFFCSKVTLLYVQCVGRTVFSYYLLTGSYQKCLFKKNALLKKGLLHILKKLNMLICSKMEGLELLQVNRQTKTTIINRNTLFKFFFFNFPPYLSASL